MKSCLNHKNFFVVLLSVAVLCFSSLPAQGKYGGGSGTASKPYLIYTAAQMNAIGADPCDWDKHFKLMADVDLSEFTRLEFNIIGTYIDFDREEPFTGVFDGNNHIISNFSTSYRGNATGLFGCVSGIDTEVRNLGLAGPKVGTDGGGGLYTGSLVGLVKTGRILGCWSDGGTVRGSNRTGGLIGKSSGGIICNSYSSSNVSGADYTGGLVGYGGRILNCYATGSVAGDEYVGGLAGYPGQIANSYSTGRVSGYRYFGGLVGGSIPTDTVWNSFWDMDTSGQTSSPGGIGKTTIEMQDANTFLVAGWDFVGEFENGPSDDWAEPITPGYPLLTWQVKPLHPLPAFSGGSGEPNDPYLISSANDLNRIGHNARLMKAHFKLISDIDLSSGKFFNIANIGYRFNGVFDGNGHTISNFTHSLSYKDFIGLFTCVDSDRAQIRNLGLIDPNINAETEDYVGSLIGLLIEGTVSNCWCEGARVEGDMYVGGLVGFNYNGEILECYSTSQVSGDWFVGGLVGFSEGNVSTSYATGIIEGDRHVGGLMGSIVEGSVNNSYSEASVSGDELIGGLLGSSSEYSSIADCYSRGRVIGNRFCGGLVGHDNRWSPTMYSSCFWDSDVNPDVNGIGNKSDPNVIGESTTNMQKRATFADAGWDFTTPIWMIDEGNDYPRLCWETSCGLGNIAPVACIVGGDRTVEAEADCRARVTLDGSCSSDADSTPGTNDDIEYFDWYELIDPCDPNSDIFLGTGQIIDCNLPLGEHDIILEVTDKACAFDNNEVVITVEDRTPPEFSLTVTPDTLRPPNHKMVEITPSWTVSDECDGAPEVTLVSITSNEDDDAKGDGHTSDDIQVIDGNIYLRAERSGKGNGRIYTIIYQAVDDSGNVTQEIATVTVPHDRRRAK